MPKKPEEEMSEVGRVYWRNKWLINYVLFCLTVMTVANVVTAIKGGS